MMNVKENELISVIVPVYNVEKYLKYCLDSICSQTYQNLEIILVDDASTDKSGELCEEYAKKDLRIICLHHKNNKGPSAARNLGIENAKGKYVAFVDGDDEIEHNMLEILYKAIKKYKVTIARCGIGIVHKLGNLKPEGINESNCKYEILRGDIYLLKHSRFSPCCGMYDIRYFRKMKFPEGRFYEDFYLMPRVLCKAKKIVYVGNVRLYHYFKRTGSTICTAQNGCLKPDSAWAVYKNMQYFKNVYGKKSFVFKIMQECILKSCVMSYLETKVPNVEFMKIFRKTIIQNCYSIFINEYFGWRLKLAIVGIFFIPKTVLLMLNYEEIRNEQKNIIEKRIAAD